MWSDRGDSDLIEGDSDLIEMPPNIPKYTPHKKTHYLGSRIIIETNGEEVEIDNKHEEICLFKPLYVRIKTFLIKTLKMGKTLKSCKGR